MGTEVIGFVGLGNMGRVLASNLSAVGADVVAHDVAGADRAPPGVPFLASSEEVARRAEVVVFSLPNAEVSRQVGREIARASGRLTTHIVDTSTVGLAAAEEIAAELAAAGIAYVDAPVSGGPAGARARTLTIMVAGSDAACARVEPVLAGLSDRRHRVGDRPGLGQAMKLANNFLSATALAATSEAIAFGQAVGLEMADMLEVLAVSSGQSSAVTDKFPTHVLSGRYASGFSNALMHKDLQLYLSAARERGGAISIGRVTASVWEAFAEQQPGVDFTRIYPFVAGAAGPSASAQVEQTFDASPDVLWQCIRAFGDLSWIPGDPKVEVRGAGVGQVRVIERPHGEVREQLTSLDDAARSLTYVVPVGNPVKVRSYEARMTVSEDAGRGRLTWTGCFEPDGVSAEEATRDLERRYRGAMRAIAAHLARGG